MSGFDVNERPADLKDLVGELEGDAADLGYVMMRLRKLSDLIERDKPEGVVWLAPAMFELASLMAWVGGRQLAYLSELNRLRTPED